MKNNLFKFYIASTVAAYAIINIIVFVAVDFDRLNNAQFWISWGFMFGFNTLVAVVTGIKIKRKDNSVMRIEPLSLILAGNAIYLILGILFTLFMPSVTVVATVDSVIAIIYALLVYRFILIVDYIRTNDETRKQKVAYIRNMTSMVESYASLAADADISDKIKALAADFRYSDPMSHPSLAGREEKLMEMVVSLEDTVRAGDESAVTSAVDGIKRELKIRNSMCANLK